MIKSKSFDKKQNKKKCKKKLFFRNGQATDTTCKYSVNICKGWNHDKSLVHKIYWNWVSDRIHCKSEKCIIFYDYSKYTVYFLFKSKQNLSKQHMYAVKNPHV